MCIRDRYQRRVHGNQQKNKMKIILLLTFLTLLNISHEYDAWNCIDCQQQISANIRQDCRSLNPGNYTGQQYCEKQYQEGVSTLTSCLQTHGCFTIKTGYGSNCICANCTLNDYTKNQPYNNFLKCLLGNNCGGDNRGQCFGEMLKSFGLLTLLLFLFFIFFKYLFLLIHFFLFFFFFFFFKQKTAYEISACLVGSEMCIRDRSFKVQFAQIQFEPYPVFIVKHPCVQRQLVKVLTPS
eukprot:TRINITY_DN1248_c0_g1_i12.p2 TRINITY_DN1248_c0_g1~~TRINITY_DN1248_c0_g1_i12.p2  ORF type:complete len:238 (-),score=35.93 TRINITY_DN1248_c0_g1_i12:390-1103(-)